MYPDKLGDIADKYDTYHRTIKMKSDGVKSGGCIGYGVEHNDKDSKFTVGDYVRMSKYKNNFAKVYSPN